MNKFVAVVPDTGNDKNELDINGTFNRSIVANGSTVRVVTGL